MGLNQASFYGDNLTSPDTGHQYGPYNLGSCNKLLHVTASLSTSYPGVTVASNFTITFGILWGFQWVPHGNSPLALPAAAFEANFLWAEYAAHDKASDLAWTPAANTASFSTLTTVTREWRGQLPINQNIDLYLTTAYGVSSSEQFQGSFLMRVTNST